MSVYIKDMDMPTDCLACRIACDKENYGVIGRPPKCPLAEAAAGDLISRADAIEAVRKELVCDGRHETHDKTCRFIADVLLSALPPADVVSREDYHNLLTASNDIDRALREYQAKEEQLSAEAVEPIYDTEWVGLRRDEYEDLLASAEAVQGEWIMHGEPPWYVRECSECGTKWHQWSGDPNPNYCGHCGAKMTKGGDSE